MRISWLVHTLESKAYLRASNVVGVRWCMYICNCTWIYIGKLNILNKIVSLQWSNNWEPNIFNEQHQYTILSLLAHPFGVQDLDWLCLCYLHFLSTASAVVWFISLFVTFTTPVSQVLLDMGCQLLYTSHPHTLLPSSSEGPECTVTCCDDISYSGFSITTHCILSKPLKVLWPFCTWCEVYLSCSVVLKTLSGRYNQGPIIPFIMQPPFKF